MKRNNQAPSATVSREINVSRRQFIKTTSITAGGLVIAFQLPGCGLRRSDVSSGERVPAAWIANAFVHIAQTGKITVLVNHQEMGQGVYTSLPMLIAEELDADWEDISVELAPVKPEYHHAVYNMRLTGGSTSVSTSWQGFRTAGAMARVLLMTAAAKRWAVDTSSLRTKRSQVIHAASGRTTSYASLVNEAASLPPLKTVELKDPKEFSLIGTDVKRLEGPEKVSGAARYSLDVQLPNMLVAVVAHPPVYGSKVIKFQSDKALAFPGVTGVKKISTGVAVIARDFWSAKSARDLLNVEWDASATAPFSTTKQQAYYRTLVDKPGPVGEDVGDTATTLSAANTTIEALYELPYLAHACMEPLSCTALVGEDFCELWLGTQAQTFDQNLAAEMLNIKPEQVIVHGQLMGGGFGRRVSRQLDYVGDAIEVAKGENVPVKTLWTREEDIQGAYYRPLFTQKVTASLDENGMPEAWLQRLVGQSIHVNTPFASTIVNGIDYGNLGGAMQSPYAIANRRIELHGPESPIPVHWWRAISYTQNTFVAESFIDEIAHAGKQDPLILRQKLLAAQPRHLRVMALVADKSGWGAPLPEGYGRGIAVQASMGSYVAQVIEVSVSGNEVIKVHRVTCVVDCGIAINPLNVEAQMQGAIVFGLSAALYGEITIEEGKVQQSNFHDYRVLRMDEVPEINVHIVKSDEAPSGIGEPGVPPVAPALTNAIFSATGRRVRKLPIRL